MANPKPKKKPEPKGEGSAPELEETAVKGPEEPEQDAAPEKDAAQDKAPKGADAAAAQKEAEALKAENAVLSDQLLRLAAEYDNFRKRTQKEKDAIYGDAVCDVVGSVLPAIDNLERATEFKDGDASALCTGVEMTLKTLFEALGKKGLKEIETGGGFDPSLHNAVMHVEDDALPENSIVEVLQKGYTVGDRVVRHAMVKVAN